MMIDIQSSIVFNRSPCLSINELSIPLPAARDLWEAPGAVEWKMRAFAKNHMSCRSLLTLLDVIYDPLVLESDMDYYDNTLITQAAVYALWMRVCLQQDIVSFHARNQPGARGKTSAAVVELQHQEMKQHIAATRERFVQIGTLPLEGEILCEFFLLSLFISLDDIQRLAGRFGDIESAYSHHTFKSWIGTNHQYNAAWHAGQILRLARLLPPMRTVGIPSIIVYHGCLSLWAVLSYSDLASFRSSSLATLGTNNLTSHAQVADIRNPMVVLNGYIDGKVQTYLLIGQGIPALEVRGEIKPLSDPMVIPSEMSNVLRKGLSPPTSVLPPFLDRLVKIVHTLCESLV